MRLAMAPDPTSISYPPAPGLWRWYRPLVWTFAIVSVVVWSLGESPIQAGDAWMVLTLVLLGNLAVRTGQTSCPIATG